MGLKSIGRDVAGRVLAAVRKGQPTVLWPTPGLGFGNLLYFWMQADIRRASGEETWVLETPKGEPWQRDFPEVFETFGIARKDIPFRYRRELGSYQDFSNDYTDKQLASFIERYVLPAEGLSRFRKQLEKSACERAQVVINVRRGDYYSVPKFQERYGFDVRGYVIEAVDRHLARNEIASALLISDDTLWCQTQLGPALVSRGIDVEYPDGVDPMRDFATLAFADNLILANSTFSYWGGYVATVRNPSAVVVAPWFHGRAWNEGKSFHLHPSWEIVEGFHHVHDSPPLES